jgi:hypothetical protein
MEVEHNVEDSAEALQTVGTRHTPRFNRVSRRDFIHSIVLLIAWFAVWLPQLRGPIDLRWDASAYYVLGTALTEGKGYRLLNEPGEIRAVQYPPLLPLIVSAHQRLMNTSDYFQVGSRLRVLYLVISAVYLLAVYALARQLLPPATALFAGVITALSFNSFFYFQILYADLPFALLSTGFLLCQRKTDHPVFAGIGGILAAAAYLLRTAGIALLIAWVAESLVRRRWTQSALRAAIAMVPVVAWQGYVWQVTHSEEYHSLAYSYQRAPYYYPNVTYRENSSLVDPFCPELGRTKASDLFGRIARNALTIPSELGQSSWLSLPLLRQPLAKLHNKLPVLLPEASEHFVFRAFHLGMVAMGLLCIAGAVMVSTGRYWFLSLYFGLTIALVVFTPWQSQFPRYLSALAPITLIFLAVALSTICRSFGQERWRVRSLAIQVPTTIFAGMSLVQIVAAAPILKDLPPVSYYDAAGQERVFPLLTYHRQWHALDRAFEWIRKNAQGNAVIATTVPQLAYLRSGHKAVMPPLERDPEQARRLLDEVPVSYLVLDELGQPPISDHYAAPVITRWPEKWRLVYTAPNDGAKVYERVP